MEESSGENVGRWPNPVQFWDKNLNLYAQLQKKEISMDHTLKLKNLRLETGFAYENGEVSKTLTKLFTIEIKDGKLASISEQNPDADGLDMKGCLMLPAFKGLHTHLDKHLFGLPWQAKKPENKTVKDMIAYEQKMIPQWLESATGRTRKLIELLQLKGSHFARSHVNIDSTSKLDSLHQLLKALNAYKDFFDWELVAFPQHGLFYTPSAEYMKEAAQLKEIDFIGGLDPYTIDGSIEKSLDFTLQLALDNQKGVDIHLHEMGQSGVDTLEYLIAKVNENPFLKGKTFVSHAFALAVMEEKVLEEMADKLAEAEIGIITTFPFRQFKMPIPQLMEKGVNIKSGTDNIYDHWSTFGSASMLEKARMAAQLYGWESELELSQTLVFATDGLTPLDREGNQQWPKIGDVADFVFLEASCSAEAIARLKPVKAMVHRGELVFSSY